MDLKTILVRACRRRILKESFHLFREYINYHKHNGRKIDVKHHFGEVSDSTRRKGIPCYTMAKIMAELWPSVLWKVEFIIDETDPVK